MPEPATHLNSEPNDFVVDEKHGAIYIADEGVGRDDDGFRAALIVDLKSVAARRVLEGHASTRPEDIPIRFDGRDVVKLRKDGGVDAMRAGADGIALDHRSEWLYYGPLNESAVYRIQVADLSKPPRRAKWILGFRLGSGCPFDGASVASVILWFHWPATILSSRPAPFTPARAVTV